MADVDLSVPMFGNPTNEQVAAYKKQGNQNILDPAEAEAKSQGAQGIIKANEAASERKRLSGGADWDRGVTAPQPAPAANTGGATGSWAGVTAPQPAPAANTGGATGSWEDAKPAATATPPATTATPKPESLIGKPQQLNIATGGTSQGVYKIVGKDGGVSYGDKDSLNKKSSQTQVVGKSTVVSQNTEKTATPLPPTESQSFNNAIESSSPATRAENSGAQQVAEKQAVATNSPQQEEKTAKSLPVENAQNKTPPINPSSQPANVDSQTQTDSTTQSNAAITQPRGGVSNLGTSLIAPSSEQPLIGAPQRQAFNQAPITSNVLPNEERENAVQQMIARNDQLQQGDMTIGRNRINAKYAHNQNEQLMGFDVNSKQRNQLEQQKQGQADLNERGNNSLEGWKTLLNSDDAKKARAIQQQQADQQGEYSRAEIGYKNATLNQKHERLYKTGETTDEDNNVKYSYATASELAEKKQQGNTALAAADKLVAAAKKSGNKEDYNQALAHRNALDGE